MSNGFTFRLRTKYSEEGRGPHLTVWLTYSLLVLHTCCYVILLDLFVLLRLFWIRKQKCYRTNISIFCKLIHLYLYSIFLQHTQEQYRSSFSQNVISLTASFGESELISVIIRQDRNTPWTGHTRQNGNPETFYSGCCSQQQGPLHMRLILLKFFSWQKGIFPCPCCLLWSQALGLCKITTKSLK